MSSQEQQLCHLLMKLPSHYNDRYNETAHGDLLTALFWCMARGQRQYLELFFPPGTEPPMKLRDAQGAVEGAEYSETARGRRCGHIFKPGEASYACRTCSADETCVLCSRCFESTDHEGHMVRVNISVGNSGCCDCGDDEAWKVPVHCTIHSEMTGPSGQAPSRDKGKRPSTVPHEVVESITMTVARVLDFICDVISCSPEQLRHPKTKDSIRQDEVNSRLSENSYGVPENAADSMDYSLVLWNDEKHTLTDVQHHVARSCKTTEAEGLKRARETDSIGRSILKYSDDLDLLLETAKKLEEIRVTVTIRSARDTFREQMCATMIDWLSDIGSCSVGNDHSLLRHIVCQQMLQPWRQGSPGSHKTIGRDGIADENLIAHEIDKEQRFQRHILLNFQQIAAQQIGQVQRIQQQGEITIEMDAGDADDETDDDLDDLDDDDDDIVEIDINNLHAGHTPPSGSEDDGGGDSDVVMEDAAPAVAELVGTDGAAGAGRSAGPATTAQRTTTNPGEWRVFEGELPEEEDEAAMAGFPPPPPPPATAAITATTPRRDGRELTPSDSDAAETLVAPLIMDRANADIPTTTGPGKARTSLTSKAARYWLETPAGYMNRDYVPPAEDVFRRVRLDWLILFDLRLWKRVRNDLRALYISTVVQVPEFKRILGLRFASLYTILAQLYLVGDREPDHSIVNLSLQMFTTPSITAELVERGNFLTCLLAILYTFLTTRQVGHPWDVSPSANLAFDSGSVTNRRMYHFYMDLRYLFSSPHVQERIRCEERYLMQFLDLVKLHQSIGPNIRALGEHVEYETDSWITASLVTREINRMSRQLADAFRNCQPHERHLLSRAIRLTAKTVMLYSIGAERNRFTQGEIKQEVKFKHLHDFEFDVGENPDRHKVVKFVVESDHISFHHALHYTLSWLIECAKSFPAQDLRTLLSFSTQELFGKPRSMGKRIRCKTRYRPEDFLMAAFDYPLRVCAWLAQIKANMWVRNGISLRHQAATYRGVNQRDVSHHRDIFLLQTAMVTCDPCRVLTSMVDRFGMVNWVKGIFEHKSESQDDIQHLDVAEDMIHLLIVLLSDRTSLMAPEDEPNPALLAIRRDLIHVLCFKPLSFNEICNKMPDRYESQEDFHQVLETISTFKAPEGVSDVGTFELKSEHIEEVDPYIAHYNKNQREESELAYRKNMALKSGKNADDIVYEPKLRPIPSGVFMDLAAFTSTGMFAQIIYYSLLYPLVAAKLTPTVPFTRVETFLQVVLHLILIAIAEDQTHDDDMTEESLTSFVYIALMRNGRHNFMPESPMAKSIVALLDKMSTKEELKAGHKKIALILKRMKQKRPVTFEQAFHVLGLSVDRINTASPAVNSAEEELEKKKRAALTRQKILDQMQKQQKSFMENQGKSIDWGVDLDDDENDGMEDRKHNWKYPAGTCILCQEETDDGRLYGTFGLLYESRIMRQTNLQDADFVREAFQTPSSLDRSADMIRPFGLAHENRTMVEKVNQQGEKFMEERQTIGKGFPADICMAGPVLVGCGHIMHYSCFTTYFAATQRRHHSQIARHHPENLERNEFVCPLCKALGNVFLPIIWKGKEESYPGNLQASLSFGAMLENEICRNFEYDGSRPRIPVTDAFQQHAMSSIMLSGLAEKTFQLLDEAWYSSADTPTAPVARISVGTGLGAHTVPVHESNLRESISSSDAGPGLAKELVQLYRRLRDTLKLNELKSTRNTQDVNPRSSTDQLCLSDVLVKAVGYTISTAELTQRGVEAGYGMTFLEKIPESQLTHLRILSDTVASYIAAGSLRSGLANNQILQEVSADANSQHCKLFISQYVDGDTQHIPMEACELVPLLSHDIFTFLVECDFGLREVRPGMDIMSLVRICYLAELVKVVYCISRNIPANVWLQHVLSNEASNDRELLTFTSFAFWITRYTMECVERSPTSKADEEQTQNDAFSQPGLDNPAGWLTFVKKYALVFLRKCVVLLYVKHGVDFNSHISPEPDADELDRLAEALRLPPVVEMCAALTDVSAAFGWPEATKTLVGGWIRHEVQHYSWGRHFALVTPHTPSSLPSSPSPPQVLSHPGIFELVGLPKNFDALIEESTRRKCPNSGRDLGDPMLCLLCGDMFCGQSVCCLKEERLRGHEKISIGGAQQHMRYK